MVSTDRPAATGRLMSNALNRDNITKIDGINPALREDDQERRQRLELRPLLSLWPYLARHRGKLILAGVSLVISAVAMLAIPLAVRRVVDLGFGGHDGAFINHYFAMLIVIGLILAVASAARFYYVNWLGERVVADLRADVFRHVADLGPAFFERTHSGELMSRLTADTTQIKAIAGSSLSQALRSIIMLVGALVMMFVTSVHLTLMVLLAIPLIVLPLIAVGRSVRRLSRRAQDQLAEASAYAAENLAASRTMQAFAYEKPAAAQYRHAVELAFDAAKERMRARAWLTALAMFLVVASIVAVLWFGAAAVVDGTMSVGRLSQFVLYAVFAGASFAQVCHHRRTETWHSRMCASPIRADPSCRPSTEYRSTHCQARRSRSWARRAPARARSSICCFASSIRRSARFSSTASMLAAPTSSNCARAWRSSRRT
jgi:ATP-binding cassette subfamily B protein